jgi:TolB-like protein/DNA-binding winged helix-turn-helix (wHTH) protein
MTAEAHRSDEDARRPFRVAGWRVDPATGYVSRDGRVVKLEPRVLGVLSCLARHAGDVVSREELERTVWAGRVVSYDALTGTVQKLRKALQDDPRRPRIIETLSKRGYRLIAPVTDAGSPAPGGGIGVGVSVPRRPKRGPALSLAAGIILVTGLTVMLLWSGLRPVAEDRGETHGAVNSIAVLPFVNLSADPAQEYFSEGITDDLITRLAKDPTLFVIARDSSFLYKGPARDLHEVADRLRVRYVLSGSVRREDGRLRLNAQLVDTDTGSNVWAEHYEGGPGDIFAVQDEIARRTAAVLGGVALDPGVPAVRKAPSVDAYDAFLHGRNRFLLYASRSENTKARELYGKALELDPEFALAHAMLAWTYAFEAMNGWSEDRDESLNRAMERAARATALDDALPVAHFVTGLVHRERGAFREALREAEKAIELDPSYANAHVLLATLRYYSGRPEEGLELVRKAMRLNPHHPYNYPFHLGQACYILGRYDEAIEAFEQGLRSNPSSERLHVWLAAAYAQSGRTDDANWEAEQVLVLNPDFSPDRIREAFPFNEPRDLAHFMDGLKKAGLAR